MILEPKAVPTIIRVDRAYLDKHDPNRYKHSYPVYRSIDTKKLHIAKLKTFLSVPRSTTEMATHLGVSFQYLRHLLLAMGAKNVLKGKPKHPGIWTL